MNTVYPPDKRSPHYRFPWETGAGKSLLIYSHGNFRENREMINLLFALLAQASPVPCQFSLMPNGYDLGKAYQASFLVVVARAETYSQDKPQALRVIRVIKGTPTLKELTLEGNHLNGTDSWGAAITPGRDTLVFLSGKNPYGWVDGGSGCPNSFEMEKGSVKFGGKKVKVEDVKKFLEGSPKL